VEGGGCRPAGGQELGEVDLGRIPKHIREIRDRLDDDALVYRRRSPILFFLIPFTCLWSGGSVGMIYIAPLVTGKGIDIGQALFGIPFLIGSVVLISVIAFLLFGRWEIRLRREAGSAFVGVGRLGWTRRFTLARTTTVGLAQCGASVNNRPVPCIRIETDGSHVSFGAFIHEDSKRYLAARIRAHIATL
jgi:hypothetical protein